MEQLLMEQLDGTIPDETTSDETTSNGTRYVDEIFTNVSIEEDVVYGANIGIITQAPALEDLTMDIYTPDGDEANRPTSNYFITHRYILTSYCKWSSNW